MPYKDPEVRRAYQHSYMCAYRMAHPKKRKDNAVYKSAYDKVHRKETLISYRAWIKAHPNKKAEYRQRRRAFKRGATIGPIDLEAIKVRDKMLCAICGKKVDEKLKHPHPKSLSFDHSWPLILGGPHSQENLRVAHLHCNLTRGAGRLSVQMVLV